MAPNLRFGKFTTKGCQGRQKSGPLFFFGTISCLCLPRAGASGEQIENVLVDGWMDGGMDGEMDGQMDGETERCGLVKKREVTLKGSPEGVFRSQEQAGLESGRN